MLGDMTVIYAKILVEHARLSLSRSQNLRTGFLTIKLIYAVSSYYVHYHYTMQKSTDSMVIR